jgi:hypothetical protein
VQASWIENAPKRARAKQKALAGEKREKKSQRSMPPHERLFIGCYPTGIVYADCAGEVKPKNSQCVTNLPEQICVSTSSDQNDLICKGLVNQ